MSALGTAEEVASTIEHIAQDLSYFAPPPEQAVAAAIELASASIAAVLKAIEEGANPEDPLSVAQHILKQASDIAMKAELGK